MTTSEKHDYQPGEDTHPMSSEPNCAVRGQTKRAGNHYA